jgi:hypothetical protein
VGNIDRCGTGKANNAYTTLLRDNGGGDRGDGVLLLGHSSAIGLPH